MGFEGDYLFDGHTRAHVRELWRARLGETGTYEHWQAAGSPRLETGAGRVDGILASPAPEFPDDLGARVRPRSSPRSSPAASERKPTMTYADKCYVGKRVKLELLSPDEVRQIHEATLDVLENVGVKFHSQSALDVLEATRRRGRPRDDGRQDPGRRGRAGPQHAPRAVHPRRPQPRVRPPARRRARLHQLRRLRRLLPRAGTARCARRARRTSATAPGSCRRSTTWRHDRRRLRPGLPARDARAARVRRLRAQQREAHHRRQHQGGLGGAQPHQDGRGAGRRQRKSSGAGRCSRPSSAP